MAAASRAFHVWQREEGPRRDALTRAADIVAAHADELGRLVTQEQGKTLANAVREVSGAAARFRYAAGLGSPHLTSCTISWWMALRVESVAPPLAV